MTNREPDAWPTRIGAITLFVEDVPAAKEFCRTVFGLSGVSTVLAALVGRSKPC